MTASTPPTRQAVGKITGIYSDGDNDMYHLEAEVAGCRYSWTITNPADYTVGTPITLEVPA